MTSQRITAWSYSRFQTYEQCPRKAKLQFIDRLKTASSPALENGLLFHKECERYLKGRVKTVPPLLKTFEKELMDLREKKCESEVEMCFTDQWLSTGWFDHNAWVRIKIDALLREKSTLRMIDFKTGRVREDHVDQLSLYALAGFMMEPKVTSITGELLYFDNGHVEKVTFKRKDMDELRASWEESTVAMLSDEDFAPLANRWCSFCDFSKNATGEHKGKCGQF